MKHLLEFLEILEESIPDGISESYLKKEFKDSLPRIMYRCLQEDRTQQLITKSTDQKWHITPKGIRYLDQLRYKDMQKNHLVLSNSLTLVIVLMAIITFMQPLILIFDGLFRYEILEKTRFISLFIGLFTVFLLLIIGALFLSWMEEKRIREL